MDEKLLATFFFVGLLIGAYGFIEITVLHINLRYWMLPVWVIVGSVTALIRIWFR